MDSWIHGWECWGIRCYFKPSLRIDHHPHQTASMIDLSSYKPLEVSSTYDTRVFASMGYVLHDDKWSKKGLVKVKVEQPKGSKISADSASELLKEAGEIKGRLATLEDGMQQLQRPGTRTSKDTSTDVGKLNLHGWHSAWRNQDRE